MARSAYPGRLPSSGRCGVPPVERNSNPTSIAASRLYSTVREAGKDIGGIADFNGGYAEALKAVRADAVLGGQLGVGSTPTVFLNGRKLGAGVVDPAALDALIDLELKLAK